VIRKCSGEDQKAPFQALTAQHKAEVRPSRNEQGSGNQCRDCFQPHMILKTIICFKEYQDSRTKTTCQLNLMYCYCHLNHWLLPTNPGYRAVCVHNSCHPEDASFLHTLFLVRLYTMSKTYVQYRRRLPCHATLRRNQNKPLQCNAIRASQHNKILPHARQESSRLSRAALLSGSPPSQPKSSTSPGKS